MKTIYGIILGVLLLSTLQAEAQQASFNQKLADSLHADEYGMKKYVMVLLKTGPKRDQDSATAAVIQAGHMQNIGKLVEAGKLIVAGPFLDKGELRGIFILDVPTLDEAKLLTEEDPAVKSGRLIMELHPWYGSAALPLVTPMHNQVAKKESLMGVIDWIVLIVTLIAVISYGVYKSSHEKNLDSYFKSNNSMSWFLILLSIMGTQASAITFLSAPGQAYTDGMRFVQYYFGLPLAMVVLCITFVPIYHKLKVYTAYEFLEQRFDLRTRALTSSLFLISRGLSTGISIYAPSIILSSLLGWNIYATNLVMGGLLIIYTMTGGAKAVAYTQMQQLFIVFVGMFLAGYMVVHLLPEGVGFADALQVAGKMGKLNIIETKIDISDSAWWKDKYNIWSGVIGGFFLALSYFGTDQSQVGRYLTAKNIKESRMGLLMNGLVKVPMQFLILLIGALVFSFYLFYNSPVFFNQKQLEKVENSQYKNELVTLQSQQDSLNKLSQYHAAALVEAIHTNDKLQTSNSQTALAQTETEKKQIRKQALSLIKLADKTADVNDTNYIFLYFVVHHLPVGLIGLLIAVIFLAAWGSIAAALNSLASSTVIDLYQRMWVTGKSDLHYYKASKWITLFWGLFCIATAMFASQLGSLIEAVNVLGSLFYGTMLGIFVVAFYMKRIGSTAVFYAAIIAEIAIISIYIADVVSFLWLNVIGCLLVMIIASLFPKKGHPTLVHEDTK